MKVAIISYSDDPEKADFMRNDDDDRLLFADHESAERWLEKYAVSGISYRLYDGD